MHPFLDDQFLTDARDGRTIALCDVRLAVEAVNGLSGDSLTCRHAIAVHAQNGVVILEGSVDSEVCKIRAGQIAGDGRDAVDVCNCLTVFSGSAGPPGRDRALEFSGPAVALFLMLWILLACASVTAGALS